MRTTSSSRFRPAISALLVTLSAFLAAPAPACAELRFAVFSDIHASPKALASFRKLVPEVVRMQPKFVVIVGDSTNGNQLKDGDRHPIATVRSWWKGLLAALAPLRDARIPVLLVAGNHDYYQEKHKTAYREAWHKLREFEKEAGCEPIPVTGGEPPEYYAADVEGVHLNLLHVVTQAIWRKEADWLRADLATVAAKQAKVRLAFGHVPIVSVMGNRRIVSPSFTKVMGEIFAEGNVAAYVAGHEHLVWEEELRFGEHVMRQVSVGTASGTYNYGIHPSRRARYCESPSVCRFPCKLTCRGGTDTDCPCPTFDFNPGKGEQKNKLAFTMVEVDDDGAVQFLPFTLDRKGAIVGFQLQ